MMRILLITDKIPYPVISGSTLRTYNLLERIARKHELWLTAFAGDQERAEGIARMGQLCQGVDVANIEPERALDRPTEFIRYLLKGEPPDLRFQSSKPLADMILRLIHKVDFDVVQIEHTHMGLYLKVLPYNIRSRTIWMLHDVDWCKYRQISRLEKKPARKLRMWLHSFMLRRWEAHFAERFSRCITVSRQDRRVLMAANPRLKVDIIPNGVDTKAFVPLSQEHTAPRLAFVGDMAYPPCADAVAYFVKAVLPLIRQVIANVELWVVGKNPLPEVRMLQGNGVYVTGFVEDVRPYYAQTRVCVVPLRAGTGTRLKILEAMALGRPVVSTSIGCQGLEVIDDQHLLIADTPKDFADKTVRLLTDEAVWRGIAQQARELVENRYDWDFIANQLMLVYSENAAQAGRLR